MQEKCLLSTAYFPPVHYFSLLPSAGKVYIEKRENYIKQTWRNRCSILTANGPVSLIVPVLSGSYRKNPISDIKIDYSKKWQQIHLRALVSSYRHSPYFEFYYEQVEKVILGNHKYLLDLNTGSLDALIELAGIKTSVSFTTEFKGIKDEPYDFRYLISPKKDHGNQFFLFKEYPQVFREKFEFIPGLSTLDLLFNTGPDASDYLPGLIVRT
jgi:hypothetical protein